MNSIQKIPEQQTDDAMKVSKALLPKVRNPQETNEIKRRLDSLGHEANAVSEIVND